ncbi:Glycoside hydrolase family 76 protein [Mycena venus]|uniref:Glycoside hydrolase family 76 protein n=1 Tax=Mycena venus TaxID=2733690 RepID=A0A8H7CVH0_9AGAR|nr:Glycoside hydrolase family 76 protein [Mycena venus]
MLPFLRVYGWAIFHGTLAVLASSEAGSSSWRKPNVTLSSAERVALAEFRATVYYQMADFDALTNNTTYANDLRDEISATTQSQEKAAKPESIAHAAIRAYSAYKDPVFLSLANESWTFARSYTIFQEDVAAGSMPGKDFTLQPICQNASMVGGTFETTNSTDPNIAGFATPYFLTLSAMLAEATSDPIYLNAAYDSVDFIASHLLATNLVLSSISANPSDNCALDNAANSFNTGLMIEGLAVLYSITNNASTQALLNNVVAAAISNNDWQTADGIIAQGGSKLGDKYIVRGLAEAYKRNATSPDVRVSVHDFIGVQFNAVVDLTTESGTSIYGGAWTGPPSVIFSQSNQTTAISALLSAMILDDVDPTSSVSEPPPPPASSSVVPHATKTPVAVMTGSVVGSVVLVAIGVALWFVLRRRKRIAGPESSLAMASAAPRPVTVLADVTAYQTSPTSPTLARNSITKFGLSFEPQVQRHCVNEQAQSPVDTVNTTISPTSLVTSTDLPLSSVAAWSPVEQLPTTELVRVLNERLRGRQWDEEEVPPQYGTEQ